MPIAGRTSCGKEALVAAQVRTIFIKTKASRGCMFVLRTMSIPGIRPFYSCVDTGS